MMSEKMMVSVEFLWSVHELVKSVQKDDTGQMIAGIWLGGNGGLLSKETLALRDKVMHHMDSMTIPVPAGKM